MNNSILMLAASRQGDLTREAEQAKMAARFRAAARSAKDRAERPALRLVRSAGLTATGIRPTAQGR